MFEFEVFIISAVRATFGSLSSYATEKSAAAVIIERG
jgi:hypothetical protein